MDFSELTYEQLFVAYAELSHAKIQLSNRCACCFCNPEEENIGYYFRDRVNTLAIILVSIENRMNELRNDVSDMVN